MANNNFGRRLIPEYLLKYSEDLHKNHPDPSASWGGGSEGGGDYTAGYGIKINDKDISVDQDVVASKSDIITSYNDLTDKPTIPAGTTNPFLRVTDANDTVFFSLTGAAQTFFKSLDLKGQPPVHVNLHALNPVYGNGLTSTYNSLHSQLEVAVDTSVVALKSDIPTIPTLATVATTGSYNDLIDKPKIPTNYVYYTNVSDRPYVDIGNYYGSGAERGFTSMNMLDNTYNTYTLPGDKSGVIALTSDIPTVPTLAPVATTGSYNDLTDKPEIPSRAFSPFIGVFQTSTTNVEFTINGTDYYTSGQIMYVDDSNPIRVNLKSLNPNFGTGLSSSFNKETKSLDVAIDTTTVALKSEIPTTATSTVTPTTTQLTFTYADNTTETVTLMTAATVTTTLS